MNKCEVGARVGAILGSSSANKTVEFLGWGRYEGDEVPEGAIGWIAEDAIEESVTNPKIVLDSGQVVWGCECWWGSEHAMQSKLAEWHALGFTVVPTDIDEVRRRYREGQAK